MFKSVKYKFSYLRLNSLKEIISGPAPVGNTNPAPAVIRTSKPNQQQSTLQYCVDVVKKYDYEGFLTTLLVPHPKVRRGLFAIKAFNAEVATIRENVTFKETGLGRLHFWSDAVNILFSGNYAKLPRHPVIQELAREVVGVGALSKRSFMNLVECRKESMTDAAFQSMAHLEKYCDKSVTPIFFITFDFLGLQNNHHLDHAASHFGKAIGITNFIRAIPHNSKQRRVLIPQDLLIKYKISQENFIRFDEPTKIKDVIFEMASSAVAHYEHAKNLKDNISTEILRLQVQDSSPEAIFMAALPSKFYLERLGKRDFNPFDPSLTGRYGLLPWLLYYNKIRKRYY